MAEYGLGRAEGEIGLTYTGDAAVKRAQDDIAGLEKKSGGAGAAVQKVGTVAMVAGAAVAGGLALAVNSAANFEQRMSAIAAVSGATGDEFDALRSKALQLGKDTAFSATDAASAMEELVKAGLSVPEVLNGAADATVALAAAGEVALPRAAEVAANAMGAFNLTAKEMPRIADLYAGAANASAISVDELAQSMTAVGAVANTVGLSIDDTTAAIGLLGNAGIKGSDAGTSLKTMFMNLQPTTDKQIKLFKELGIVTEDGANRFFDAKGNVKDLAGISEVLSKSLEGMTKQQKLATLETMFGSDAIRAAAVLSDEGAKGVNKFADAMGKVSAADVAAKRLDNFKGDLEALKGSVETMAIAIGTLLIPALRQIAGAVTDAANWFLTLDEGTQKFIVIAISAVGAVLLLVGAIVKITFAIRSTITALTLIRAALATTWVAALGPIALVIAAVVAVGAALFLLWKKSETFRDIVLGVWNAIKTAATAIASWFAGPFASFFVRAYETVRGAFNSIRNVVSTAINFVKEVITRVLNDVKAVWNAVWGTFGPLIRAVWELIKSIISLAITAIKASITAQLTVVKTIVEGIWDAVKAVTRTVWNAVKDVVETVVGAIKRVVDAVLSPIANIVSRIFGAAKDAIADRLGAALDVVRNIVGKIRDFFSGAAGWLVSAGRDIISGLIEGIVSMGANLLGKVTDMVNSVKDKISGLFKIGSPSKWAEEIGKYVAQGLAIGVEKTKSEVADAANGMADALSTALENRLKAQKISPDAAKGLKDFIKQQKTDLLELAEDRENIVGRLQAARQGLEDALKIRADFAAGIAQGATGFAAIGSIVGVDEQGNEIIPDAAGLVAGLAERRAALLNYRAMLSQLAAQGLNKTTYDQLLQEGVDTGMAYAASILAGGQQAIADLNAIQGDIGSVATSIGTQTAGYLYDAGVSAAEGLLRGIRARRDEITEEMTRIARAMVRAIRRTLRMGSPSRLLRDQIATAMMGVVEGIEQSAGDVYKAMASVGSGMPTTLRGAMPAGLTSAQVLANAGTPASATTTYGGDTVTIQAQTNADPEEIVDEYVWQKKTRLLGVRR